MDGADANPAPARTVEEAGNEPAEGEPAEAPPREEFYEEQFNVLSALQPDEAAGSGDAAAASPMEGAESEPAASPGEDTSAAEPGGAKVECLVCQSCSFPIAMQAFASKEETEIWVQLRRGSLRSGFPIQGRQLEDIIIEKWANTLQEAVFSYQLDVLGLEDVWCYSATNPNQVRFDVVRLQAGALGRFADGDATPEYSWFPGMAWRMASCPRCDNHLGWYFVDNAVCTRKRRRQCKRHLSGHQDRSDAQPTSLLRTVPSLEMEVNEGVEAEDAGSSPQPVEASEPEVLTAPLSPASPVRPPVLPADTGNVSCTSGLAGPARLPGADGSVAMAEADPSSSGAPAEAAAGDTPDADRTAENTAAEEPAFWGIIITRLRQKWVSPATIARAKQEATGERLGMMHGLRNMMSLLRSQTAMGLTQGAATTTQLLRTLQQMRSQASSYARARGIRNRHQDAADGDAATGSLATENPAEGGEPDARAGGSEVDEDDGEEEARMIDVDLLMDTVAQLLERRAMLEVQEQRMQNLEQRLNLTEEAMQTQEQSSQDLEHQQQSNSAEENDDAAIDGH